MMRLSTMHSILHTSCTHFIEVENRVILCLLRRARTKNESLAPRINT